MNTTKSLMSQLLDRKTDQTILLNNMTSITLGVKNMEGILCYTLGLELQPGLCILLIPLTGQGFSAGFSTFVV